MYGQAWSKGSVLLLGSQYDIDADDMPGCVCVCLCIQRSVYMSVLRLCLK